MADTFSLQNTEPQRDSATRAPAGERTRLIQPSPLAFGVSAASWATILWTVLVGDMARGVLFPTLWPLVMSLGGDQATQGRIVACFSLGRIVSSPIWGGWSVTAGYRVPLIVALITAALGALVYADVAGTKAGLLPLGLAQACIGFGAGSLGVTRAWVAANTTGAARTAAMARLSACQYFGFTVTPFVGSIFSLVLGDNSYALMGGLVIFDRFSAPALFLFLSFILGIIMLVFFLHEEKEAPAVNAPKKAKPDSASVDETGGMAASESSGCCSATSKALLSGLTLNLLTRGVIGAFETLATELAPSFGLSAADVGLLVSVCGMIGVVQLLNFKLLYTSRHSDITLIFIGLVAMALGCAAMVHVGSAEDVAGVLPAWRLYVAIIGVYAFGYPIGNTAALGLFSKAAGSAPQGLLLGIFGMAGSGARVVFPVVSGATAQYLGKNVLFIGLTVVSFLAMLVAHATKGAVRELGI